MRNPLRRRHPGERAARVDGEYAHTGPSSEWCDATPEGEDAPVAGYVTGCTRPRGHDGRHQSPASAGLDRPLIPGGWSWPNREQG